MGTEDDKSRNLPPRNDVPSIDTRNLKAVAALGRGAKGVVFLVKNDVASSGPEYLALKVISRTSIENKKNAVNDGTEYRRVLFEQRVLNGFEHPFFPRLRGVLATDKVLGYAIDYCPGGNLNSLRRKQIEKMFSDDVIRFYAAELVLALEYLHKIGIVYRDLKPENVMIQENGHIMLVDFDLSTKLSKGPSPQSSPIVGLVPSLQNPPKTKRKKKHRHSISSIKCCYAGISPYDSDAPVTQSFNSGSNTESTEKSNSFVGTEDYVAPEIVLGNGHDFAVDWWSLGVLLYEMLYGTTPFKGQNRKETFYRILTKTPDLVGAATPLRDLIRNLLEKDPKKRIGLEGIKGHEFFRGLDWENMVQVSRPPYIPEGREWDGEEEEVDENVRIDVESFVEGIFLGDEVEKTRKSCGNNENNKTEENIVNKEAWLGGIKTPLPPQPPDFFVF